MYKAYITELKNVRPHPNADRLQLGDCFGNTVCVSLDYTEGQLGVYFPTDGQLSIEFAEYNNLLRKKDEAGNNIGGYMDPNKRNVCAIKLRGEKSDGLFLPLSSLEYTGDVSKLHAGDVIDGVLNGYHICQKYIPATKIVEYNKQKYGSKIPRIKVPLAPLFAEHADTEQLAYNLAAFKPGDEIEITLKMHGTSQRTGYLPVLSGYKRTLWDKITRKQGKPIYKYDYISGTRRTVLENFDGGFYGSNEFRQQHHDKFVGKLNKGETVYYEVVGYTHTGVPIMGNGKNEKLGKDFVKQYGKETVFSYGCEPTGSRILTAEEREKIPDWANVVKKCPQSDIYVYRMTMTNEDGFVVEYSPDFMRYRCEQMGVKCVPVFAQEKIPNNVFLESYGYECAGDWVQHYSEEFYDGPDPIGKTHVREGVVVRIVNRPKFTAFKHKNFNFKVLEGLIKDTASAPDMEEAQEV